MSAVLSLLVQPLHVTAGSAAAPAAAADALATGVPSAPCVLPWRLRYLQGRYVLQRYRLLTSTCKREPAGCTLLLQGRAVLRACRISVTCSALQ